VTNKLRESGGFDIFLADFVLVGESNPFGLLDDIQ
jgi:hypothetical protein